MDRGVDDEFGNGDDEKFHLEVEDEVHSDNDSIFGKYVKYEANVRVDNSLG